MTKEEGQIPGELPEVGTSEQRVPAAILMTDLVGSTEYAFEESERREDEYFELIDSFEALVRGEFDELVNYHYDLIENYDYLIQIDRGDEANLYLWPQDEQADDYDSISLYGHPLWELLNTAYTISQRWLLSDFNMTRLAKKKDPVVFGSGIHIGKIRTKERGPTRPDERLDGTDIIFAKNMLELAKDNSSHTRIMISPEAYMITERHHHGGYMFRESYLFDERTGSSKSFDELRGYELMFKLDYMDYKVFRLRLTESRYLRLKSLYEGMKLPREYFTMLVRMILTFLTVTSNRDYFDRQYLRNHGIPFPAWTRDYDWAGELREIAERWLGWHPDSVLANFAMGHALFKMEEEDEAEDYFDKTEELFPGISAVAKYRALLADSPKEAAEIYEDILDGHSRSAIRLAECAAYYYRAYQEEQDPELLERCRELAVRADNLYPRIIQEQVGRIYIDLVQELEIPHSQEVPRELKH